MQSLQNTTKTYNRIAYHAQFKGVYGQAIRDSRGTVWFLSDDDNVRRLTDADIPALILAGRVDVAACQRVEDLARGGAAAVACTREMGRN